MEKICLQNVRKRVAITCQTGGNYVSTALNMFVLIVRLVNLTKKPFEYPLAFSASHVNY